MDQAKLVIGGQNGPGFALALLLLREGQTVYITTRSPMSLANALYQETDHADWIRNVLVLGIDLMDEEALAEFIEYLKNSQRFSKVFYCACTSTERDFEAETQSKSDAPKEARIIRQFGTPCRSTKLAQGRIAIRRLVELNSVIPLLLQEVTGTVFVLILPIGNQQVKDWQSSCKSLFLEHTGSHRHTGSRRHTERRGSSTNPNSVLRTICTPLPSSFSLSPQETANQIAVYCGI